jgi:hypothetical protein
VLRSLILCAVAAVGLCGCAGPDTAGPERAATAFSTAVSAADGASACALLSPKVHTELVDSAGKPCPEAVLAEELPAPSAVRAVQRYGHQALVRTGTDTVFLSEFPGGWKVIAAGCEPRADEPYDCTVSGG